MCIKFENTIYCRFVFLPNNIKWCTSKTLGKHPKLLILVKRKGTKSDYAKIYLIS